ncbi:MAG: response regulator [Deltaproteobacteria bacterium]|nr:response regulator [Deltaproteobacteria bacterium]
MNVATLLSFGAALLQLGFGMLFVAISRAQGWSRARLFAVLALSAAAYAALDIGYTLPSTSADTLRRLIRLNYLFGGIHCAGWVVYAYGDPVEPWRKLPRVHRAIVALTVAFGLVAQIPGVVDADGINTVTVSSFGCTYHSPLLTWRADLYGAWLLFLLGMAFARFLRNLRRGEPGARTQVVGFSVMFACSIVELLVSSDLLEFIYTGDLGFLAIVIVVLTETVRHVLNDSRALAAMGRDLAAQVESRTRERDVARDALAHAERLAAVGQLAAGVGHEINNPLTVAQANLESLHESLLAATAGGPAPDPALAADALDSLHRIGRVVADLRSYALPASERQEVVDLTRVLRSALKLTSHHLRHVATITEDLHALALVPGDAVRLSQVFVNLLANAGQALERAPQAAPTITLRGRMLTADRVSIEIIDNGVGIGPEALARLSEPYFSTRHDRGGTGLGLFVARNILSSVGGTLEFISELGRGTTARVTLPTVAGEAIAPTLDASEPSDPGIPIASAPPIAAPSAPPITALPEPTIMPTNLAAPTPPSSVAPPSPPPASPVTASARRRALVIDDEPTVGRIVARQLAAYDVALCTSGREALALLDRDPAFDVIICDLMMPLMSGVELHATLERSHPACVARMLFVSGGAVTADAEAFLSRADIRCVMKPFTRAELAAAIEAIVASVADGSPRQRSA